MRWRRRALGKPLTWIGHSLGGQALGLVPNRARIAKAVAIAAGSGYPAASLSRSPLNASIVVR